MIFCTPTVLHACRVFGARCTLVFRSTARLVSRAHNTLRRDADRASADCCPARGMLHVRPVIAHAVCHSVCRSVCHSVTLCHSLEMHACACTCTCTIPAGRRRMRYTSHQSEMLTTPASSRLTPSPIHDPRRLSLPARAARPEAPTHIAPFLHPAPTSQSSLSPGPRYLSTQD
jgi:hypothetical protein